jgi:DNA-binding transcriptional ArsR family regulator
MSSQTAAEAVWAALSEVAKALGHEHRIALIEQLAQGPRSVEALANRVGPTAANASQHRQQLHRAGLLSTQRDGKCVVYRLADDAEAGIVSLPVLCGTLHSKPLRRSGVSPWPMMCPRRRRMDCRAPTRCRPGRGLMRTRWRPLAGRAAEAVDDVHRLSGKGQVRP